MAMHILCFEHPLQLVRRTQHWTTRIQWQLLGIPSMSKDMSEYIWISGNPNKTSEENDAASLMWNWRMENLFTEQYLLSLHLLRATLNNSKSIKCSLCEKIMHVLCKIDMKLNTFLSNKLVQLELLKGKSVQTYSNLRK